MLFGLLWPAGLCLVLSSVLFRWQPFAQWIYEPLHSTVETVGACIALGIAVLLVQRRRILADAPHFEWVATALVCMGLLDLSHACVPQSPAFYWSRALPTLLGGALCALVWLPARWGQSQGVQRLPVLSVALTLPLCALLLGWSAEWPRAFSAEGSYTVWARLINVLGGLGFLSAASFFFVRYQRLGKLEDRIFTHHCLLFGTAGVLFWLSSLWGPVWWLFHFLRLAAYGVTLLLVAELFREVQERQRQQLTRELEAQLEELQTLRHEETARVPAPPGS